LKGLVWDIAPSHRDDDTIDLNLATVSLPAYGRGLSRAE
jgi:hypothetical protein